MRRNSRRSYRSLSQAVAASCEPLENRLLLASTVYRVNAGGPSLSGTPPWSSDLSGAASIYTNAASAKSNTYSTASAIDMSDASLPAGTPMALFQTERYDAAAGTPMQWNFAVTPGQHEVRLYFAEIYTGAQAVGKRAFDVSIENSLVLNDYDVFADVGGFKGVMKSFTVNTDGNLDIDFAHVLQNPAIKGIEIIRLEDLPGTLGASTSSIDFSPTLVNQTSSATLTLTNLGGAGDGSIVIDSTSITGVNAAMFSDNFDDAGSVTLAPGQSYGLTLQFQPTSTGGKSASLNVVHSGSNTPLVVPLSGSGQSSSAISFGKSVLGGTNLTKPTSMQFGPDDRLYLAQQNGLIKIYTVARNGANSYGVTATETITSIQSIANHNDDGSLNSTQTTRLVTGLLVTGTASNPVLYVTSSDPRIGAGTSGEDLNLDTNSGIISRLTWNGSSWTKLDLVRGLPRSEENHTANGMQLDAANQILYVAMGGNTNMGAPSNNFANLPEYALSAAILEVDLAAIGNTTYDLPTLNDEDRPGTTDNADPFGGNDGKNQALLVSGGPVSVYAPGFRNPYDVVITRNGKMFTIDNGSNAGWGGEPLDPDGNVTTAATRHLATNQISEPGTTFSDGLHLITGPGYYGGHPNPTRANLANTFNATNPQSPVSVANPIEGEFLTPGSEDGALALFPESTNGLVEYIGNYFGGAMDGDLLTVGHDGKLYRIELADDGTTVVSATALFSSISNAPLDVTVPTGAAFAGTIWVCDWYKGGVYVFEPATFGGGTGADDPTLDDDGDGFDNADEIDNGTDPLSPADFPPDYDGDFNSNLVDPDDDNDTLLDTQDFFAIDASNGASTQLPVVYTWDNDAPPAGGLLQLGFTGLMSNGTSNYESLFDQSKMTTGGAAGVLTIDQVSSGTAWGAANTQQYGFQFGIPVSSSTQPFSAHTRILAPFSGLTPQAGQNMGIHVGQGDQDNYFKLVVSGDSGGTIQFGEEINGAAQIVSATSQPVAGVEYIDLYLRVDPATLMVSAAYSAMVNGTLTPLQPVGQDRPMPSGWLADSALAVGINSTSGGAPTFSATYDFIEVMSGTASQLGASTTSIDFGTVEPGQTLTQSVVLTNQGSAGDPAITIESTSILGSQAALFSDDFNDAGSITLQPGQSTMVTVSYSPSAAGAASATLEVHHSGSNTPLPITLKGNGEQTSTGAALYRVNAGGPQVAGTLNWATDTTAAPSPYSNYAAAQSRAFSTSTIVNMTHPSIPAGTPMELFQSERWDYVGGSEMLWSFPVAADAYEVRLYFAETYATAQAVGARLMDILIENQLVLNDYDVFADVGANTAVAKIFTVNADSSLDIRFLHVKNNPNIKAIEIVPLGGGSTENQLGVATSLDFGNVQASQQQSQSLVLTHLGSAGDAPIVIDSTSITGSGAAVFSDNFNDAGNITLQPGQSYTLNVSALSSTIGAKTASLAINHSGASSPAVVSLTANVVSASSALLSITPTGALSSSSYTAQSHTLSNTSQSGAMLQSITINLGTAIFPDIVYDPTGTAGDTTGKPFTVDVNGGVGTVTYEYLGVNDGGYSTLKINFTDFNPGEQMKFSLDVDPTSILGSSSPGPSSAGSVSGIEMVGATVTAQFSDASTLTARVTPIQGSTAGGQAVIKPNLPPAPTISALGISGSQAHVTQAAQTIRVTGAVGDSVVVTVIEGGLFLSGVPNGGYDIDPYEANTALGAVRYYTGTIGAAGYVDIPIVLTETKPPGGINYICATKKLPDGTEALSNFVTLHVELP